MQGHHCSSQPWLDSRSPGTLVSRRFRGWGASGYGFGIEGLGLTLREYWNPNSSMPTALLRWGQYRVPCHCMLPGRLPKNKRRNGLGKCPSKPQSNHLKNPQSLTLPPDPHPQTLHLHPQTLNSAPFTSFILRPSPSRPKSQTLSSEGVLVTPQPQ